jgi:hypothetical protein
VTHPVITIEDPASGPVQRRPASWLDGRRLLVALGLAVAEIVAYLIVDPNRWLAILLVGALLTACIAISNRIPAGTPRDLLIVVGVAQALVIAVPILVGVVSLVIATVTVILIIALFVFIGLRLRR